MADPITLERHILEEQSRFPKASGDFTRMLGELTLALKSIARRINQVGYLDRLVAAGEAEIPSPVDELPGWAHGRIVQAMSHTGHLLCMTSEDEPTIVQLPPGARRGKYVLVFDPLDGVRNLPVNVTVGTIFGIFRARTAGAMGALVDCLRPGSDLVAAGYAVYGSCTQFVYSTGRGVHVFTLDPAVGEFLLSRRNVTVPRRGSVYSVNEGWSHAWNAATRQFVHYLKENSPEDGRPYSLRYIGSLVADVHRTLLDGGVFLYPADTSGPAGERAKIHLLHEAAPLAFLLEQAGGKATTGRERVLSLQPSELHQRVAFAAGSAEDVERYERCCGARDDVVRPVGAAGPGGRARA